MIVQTTILNTEFLAGLVPVPTHDSTRLLSSSDFFLYVMLLLLHIFTIQQRTKLINSTFKNRNIESSDKILDKRSTNTTENEVFAHFCQNVKSFLSSSTKMI